jgi:hypothetical protein
MSEWWNARNRIPVHLLIAPTAEKRTSAAKADYQDGFYGTAEAVPFVDGNSYLCENCFFEGYGL